MTKQGLFVAIVVENVGDGFAVDPDANEVHPEDEKRRGESERDYRKPARYDQQQSDGEENAKERQSRPHGEVSVFFGSPNGEQRLDIEPVTWALADAIKDDGSRDEVEIHRGDDADCDGPTTDSQGGNSEPEGHGEHCEPDRNDGTRPKATEKRVQQVFERGGLVGFPAENFTRSPSAVAVKEEEWEDETEETQYQPTDRDAFAAAIAGGGVIQCFTVVQHGEIFARSAIKVGGKDCYAPPFYELIRRMELPAACIPRVEPSASHRAFVEAARPACVMINIVDARRLVKRGETAHSYFPDDVEVIVTTTDNDRKIRLINWEKELNIVRELNPDYHIPTDYPTYREQHPDERWENVEKCMEGTVWMHERLADTDVTVIPLVKGVEPRERRLCYRICEELGKETAAFYVTQYFSSGAGNNITRVEELVEKISTRGNLDVLVIGLLSPNYLERVDDNAIAAAGQYQWRTRVTPTKQSDAEISETYRNLREQVRRALSQNDGAR